MHPLLPALAEPTGKIVIELLSGIRLSVDAGVDAEALARVLSVVGR
jgi:transposase